MIVYILVLNNGQSYEDYSEWNSCVHILFDTAFKIGMEQTISDSFCIEEWDTVTGEQVCYYQCEVAPTGLWEPRRCKC